MEFSPVIGSLTASEASLKLKEMGHLDAAAKIELGRETTFSAMKWPGQAAPKPWQFTSHAFGFIRSSDGGSSQPMEIVDAGNMAPDLTLKDSRVKITLGRLRVYEYPGKGVHQILFDFYGQNQVQGQSEDLHFTQTYRVQQGEQAGIRGYPVFIGLNVGSEGVNFKCHTVNVENEDDERFIKFLDSDVFTKGLSLISGLNPAIPVISGFAVSLTKAVESRNKNVPVQDFYLGLDFTQTPAGVRLSQGSYIAVQVPDASKWDWSEWVYNPKNGQVVPRDDPTGTVPYNYLVFNVSRMD